MGHLSVQSIIQDMHRLWIERGAYRIASAQIQSSRTGHQGNIIVLGKIHTRMAITMSQVGEGNIAFKSTAWPPFSHKATRSSTAISSVTPEQAQFWRSTLAIHPWTRSAAKQLAKGPEPAAIETQRVKEILKQEQILCSERSSSEPLD